MRNRPAHKPGVGLQDSAFLLVVILAAAHEVGGEQRRDEPRHQQREHHGKGDHQPELLEVLPGDAAHEAHGNEHGDDGERDGDDGETDLVGSFERCAIGAFAHAHVAHDVLDLHDGVVDEDAGDDGDGEQADEVEREAGGIQRPERRHDGQRQGDGGDDGGAQVAQEDQHDDDGEDSTLDQRLHGRVIGAERIGHHRVDQLQLDVGVRLLQLVDLLRHVGGDHGVARARGARDGKRHHRRAVERGEGARLGVGIRDRAELIEAHLAAPRQRDHGGGEVGQGLLAGQRADRLLAPADVAAAAGQVDMGGPELAVHVAGGDAVGEQPVGIERDAHLAVDAADALDLRDALHALQHAHHGVVDEPRQLLGRHARRPRRVGHDRQAFDLRCA